MAFSVRPGLIGKDSKGSIPVVQPPIQPAALPGRSRLRTPEVYSLDGRH